MRSLQRGGEGGEGKRERERDGGIEGEGVIERERMGLSRRGKEMVEERREGGKRGAYLKGDSVG